MVIGDEDYDVFLGTPSSLVLYGYHGSTAQTYANTAGIAFRTIAAEFGTPDFVLPAALTTIQAQAFANIHATIVYIPDGVTTLGSKAFGMCYNLTQIRIPATVTVIPPDLFYDINKRQLTIFGTPGSAAEEFANTAGINFSIE